jgi:long-chain acyl-CoA synthetase
MEKTFIPPQWENTYLKSIKLKIIFGRQGNMLRLLSSNRDTLQETFQLEESFFALPDLFVGEISLNGWRGM